MLALVAVAPASLDGQAAAGHAAGVRSAVGHLGVSPEIVAELNRLADTSRNETIRCLTGVVRGDTAVVEAVLTPVIHGSDNAGVHYGGCPSGTVAEWHNHPWTAEPKPENACYLSRADIASALRAGAAPVQIVQVTAQVTCWWFHTEIVHAQHRPILWPVAGQGRAMATLSAAPQGATVGGWERP